MSAAKGLVLDLVRCRPRRRCPATDRCCWWGRVQAVAPCPRNLAISGGIGMPTARRNRGIGRRRLGACLACDCFTW